MPGMADEQDKPSKRRLLRPMKQAMYEWGAIFAAALFGLLLTYWAFSLFRSEGDFVLVVYPPRVHLVASDGKIELMSDADSHKIFTSIDRNPARYQSDVTSNTQFTLPGFKYRSVMMARWHTGEWLVRVSLLIPCAVLLAITCTCVWRYRVVDREARLDSTTD